MAKQKEISVVVVTPERQVLSETTDSVVLPAHDGELGILVDRAPIMCELGIGQMRYRKGAQTQRLFIDGGFAQVSDNNVTVLTPNAIRAEEVTPEAIGAAEQAARATGDSNEDRAKRLKAQRRLSALRSLRA